MKNIGVSFSCAMVEDGCGNDTTADYARNKYVCHVYSNILDENSGPISSLFS